MNYYTFFQSYELIMTVYSFAFAGDMNAEINPST